MLKKKPLVRSHSSATIGLMFLIPGLLWGITSLINGTFAGAAMGFCTFAVLFGAFMLLAAPSLERH